MPDGPEIVVRKARPADVGTLVSFNAAMAKETENRSLDTDQLTNGTKAVFESPDKGFYLVAEADGRTVGTLLITSERSDWRTGPFGGYRACMFGRIGDAVGYTARCTGGLIRPPVPVWMFAESVSMSIEQTSLLR